MCSYMGFCNYYFALIPHLAELAVPLNPLGQEAQIPWTPDIRLASEALPQACPDLRLRSPSKPFFLETDASAVAGAAVLKQSDSRLEYPVAFYTMAINKPARNKSYEPEPIFLLKAVSHFAFYLLYGYFTWRTAQAALRNIFRAELKLTSIGSRWILALQPYQVKIDILKGKYNTVADALYQIN